MADVISLGQLKQLTYNAVRKRAAIQCRSNVVAKGARLKTDPVTGEVYREVKHAVFCTTGRRDTVIRFYGGTISTRAPVWVSCSCVAPETLVPTSSGIIPAKDVESGVASLWGVGDPSGKLWTRKSALRITTRYGFTIAGAYDHLVLVLTPELEVTWRRLCDLRPGDQVAVQQSGVFPSSRVPVTPPPDHPDTLPSGAVACAECGRELMNLGPHLRVHGHTAASYREKFGRDRILHAAHQPIRHYLPPEVDEDLATVMGYLVSEGAVAPHYLAFYNSDPEVIADFRRAWFAAFQQEPQTGKVGRSDWSTKDNTELKCNSRFIAKALAMLGLAPVGSDQKEVPWAILRSPQSVQVAFLRALFEGDGGSWQGTVRYTSKSPALLHQVQAMLLNLGIFASVKFHPSQEGRGVLTISGESSRRYVEQIGFVSSTKRKASEELPRERDKGELPRIIPYAGARVRQAITIARAHRVSPGVYDIGGEQIRLRLPSEEVSNSDNISRERLSELVPFIQKIGPLDAALPGLVSDLLGASHLGWQEVEGIEDVGEQDLVDLTDMPDSAYISNGLVSHNCPYWLYFCEVAVAATGSTSVIYSNGAAPKIRNPSGRAYLCKHLYLVSVLGIEEIKIKGKGLLERLFPADGPAHENPDPAGLRKRWREKQRQEGIRRKREEEQALEKARQEMEPEVQAALKSPGLLTIPDRMRRLLEGG